MSIWSCCLGVCGSQTGETTLPVGQRNPAAHENYRDVPQPQERRHQRKGVCLTVLLINIKHRFSSGSVISQHVLVSDTVVRL